MRAWLPLLLLMHCAAASADVTQRNWRLYQSAHFDIYSDVRPREMRRTVQALEVFRAAIVQLTGVAAASGLSHPTHLYLFSRMRDFRALVPSEDIIGYMTPGLHHNLMVAAKPPRRRLLSSATEVVFHEYVHDLIRSASSFHYPTWYDEGLAELLSTATVSDTQLVLGKAPGKAADLAKKMDQAMPLTQALEYAETAEASSEQRVGFYLTAWLLTHYLLLSEDSEALHLDQALKEYLRVVNQGGASTAAFEDAFGMSTRQMEQRLRRYSRTLTTYPIALPSVNFNPTFTVQPLDRDAVRYLLGSLYVDGDPNQAEALLTQVAPASPHYPHALAARGRLAQQRGAHKESVRLLEQALTLDPEDVLLQVSAADGLLVQCQSLSNRSRCRDAAILQQALAHYRQARSIDPENAAANAGYGQTLIQAGRSARAIAPLRKALDRIPGNYEVVRALGIAHLEQRQWQAARYYLQRARGWASKRPRDRAQLEQLLAHIEQSIMMEQSP
ncbi:MAG: tetratricopeptide repeat protein [Pseudomonadales bacterium]